jgi:hypothetical protein
LGPRPIETAQKGLIISPKTQTLEFIMGEAYYLKFLYANTGNDQKALETSIKYFNAITEMRDNAAPLLVAYTYKYLVDANTHLGNYDKQSQYILESIPYFREAIRQKLPGYEEAEKILKGLISFYHTKIKSENNNKGSKIFGVIDGGKSNHKI